MRWFVTLLMLYGLAVVGVNSRGEASGGPAAGAAQPSDDAVYFVRDVLPVFNRAGCNNAKCHGSGGGQGGMKLSLFGARPDADYAQLAKTASSRRVDRVEPAKSLLLLKSTKKVPHKGGQRIKPGSADYRTLVRWIERGARRTEPGEPTLVSIEVQPKQLNAAMKHSQPITVTAVYSDKARRVVTADSRYLSTDGRVLTVDKAGRLTVTGYGEAHVVVNYMRQTALVKVTVPQKVAGKLSEMPVANGVDKAVNAQLKKLGIPASGGCSDAEFLRRVYLDTTGLLPTADQAREFLADKDPAKRRKLIDQLLDSPEFADRWALKWGDLLRIKSEYPSNLWPNAVQAYHHWVRDSIATNKPYDRFVREMLTSTGSNFRVPPANFYRALRKRDPQGFAEQTALVFMGARLSCARCHGHPTESWTLDDNAGMAAFFANVKFKKTQEWKEEIVYLQPWAQYKHPLTKQAVEPKPLGGAPMRVDRAGDTRVAFADWLTSKDNPWFARNISNRVWCWLMGRGIVHEPDDVRRTNPPSNPELLAYLEKELVDSDFDLKHVYRVILNSNTYQRSPMANAQNVWDDRQFSHYAVKRLPAEQMMDAINQVTETTDKFTSRVPEPYTVLPDGTRANQLADGSIGTSFLEMFGRPARSSAYESERCNEPSMRQALYMINAEQLEGKINRSPYLKRLSMNRDNTQVINHLYLSTLSRYPTAEEMAKLLEYIKEADDRKQAIKDICWAVMNTKEFLFNH